MKGKELIRVGSEATITPEQGEAARRVIDQIQKMYEESYGLATFNLLPASAYLYPRVSSPMAEHNMRVITRSDDGFFVTEADSAAGIDEQVRKLLLRKQAFRESIGLARDPHVDHNLGVRSNNQLMLPGSTETRRLLPDIKLSLRQFIVRRWRQSEPLPDQVALRKESFHQLQPVIYIHPSILKKISGITEISDLLQPDLLSALDTVAEETGHFVYVQTQHLLNEEYPGQIIAEGMALIDEYQIIKKLCSIKGISINDPNNESVRHIITQYFSKIRHRGTLAREVFAMGGFSPTASVYTKSVEVMGGFIEHLVSLDAAGQDTSQELREFYRLTGPQKGRYLRTLYASYARLSR